MGENYLLASCKFGKNLSLINLSLYALLYIIPCIYVIPNSKSKFMRVFPSFFQGQIFFLHLCVLKDKKILKNLSESMFFSLTICRK